MIALFFSISVVLGTACGWLGYKASIRIQAWGVKMNDLDEIVRMDACLEEYPETQRSFSPSTGRNAGTLLGGQHLPIA